MRTPDEARAPAEPAAYRRPSTTQPLCLPRPSEPGSCALLPACIQSDVAGGSTQWSREAQRSHQPQSAECHAESGPGSDSCCRIGQAALRFPEIRASRDRQESSAPDQAVRNESPSPDPYPPGQLLNRQRPTRLPKPQSGRGADHCDPESLQPAGRPQKKEQRGRPMARRNRPYIAETKKYCRDWPAAPASALLPQSCVRSAPTTRQPHPAMLSPIRPPSTPDAAPAEASAPALPCVSGCPRSY